MNDKIYDKIKKLLSLAGDGNFESESNTALDMANSLMQRYNITSKNMDEYFREQELGKLVNSQKEEPHLYKIWEKMLMSALAHLFNCEVVFNHDGSRKLTMRVLGREGNVRTAIAMNDWIVKKIKEDAKKKYPGRNMSARNSYALGCVDNICSRVAKMVEDRNKEAVQNGWGLVPVDEVKQFMRQQFPHLSHSKSKATNSDSKAYGAGIVDGANIGLNKQFGLKAISA